MMGLGPLELMVILAVVFVIFGAGRLAGLGGALGKSIHEFRSAVDGDEEPSKPLVTAPMTSACPSCGSANAADARFCTKCASTLRAA